MNKLSEAQVKKLNSAIDNVMDIVDNHVDPNDAIVKVAQDMNLTPDYIPVIVAAYNNGSQYAQREKGSTIAEKTAKFNLANEAIIKEKLYGNSKQANARYVESDDFFDFPVGVFVEDKKPINALYAPVIKSASYRRDSDTAARTEQRITDGVNTVVESIRMEKSAALDAYDDAIKDFAYYLRRADAPSIPMAIKLAGTVYGVAGPMAIKEAALRFELPLKEKRLEPIISANSQFYKVCSNCLEKLASYNKICDEELVLLSKCANTLKPIVSNRLNAIHKQSSVNNSSPAYFFKKKSSITKEASPARIFTPLFASPENDAKGSKLTNSDVSGLEALVRPQWRTLNPYEHNIMRSFDDPEHEATLRNIIVESNITDLLNSDEYLSDKDPEEVIEAYNELMEIAPEIHNKKPLLRAALRQYMESGGIDVQSLGLIGDIGRRTESRSDDAKRMLSENVNKMLESEEKARSEEARRTWEALRDKQRAELTVSEGRKDRMARAEEGRKQRSNQRQIAEARNAYDKFKAKLDAENKDKDREARLVAERAKLNLKNVEDRAKRIDSLMKPYIDTDGVMRHPHAGGAGATVPDNMTIQALNTALNDKRFNTGSGIFSDRMYKNNIIEHVRPLLSKEEFDNTFERNSKGSYDVKGTVNITHDMVRRWAEREADKAMAGSPKLDSILPPPKKEEPKEEETSWFNFF